MRTIYLACVRMDVDIRRIGELARMAQDGCHASVTSITWRGTLVMRKGRHFKVKKGEDVK